MTTTTPTKRLKRGTWIVVVAAPAIMATIASLVTRGPTLILWNASASVPTGLYIVQPNARLRAGDLAVTELPAGVGSTQCCATTRRPGATLTQVNP